MTELHVRAFPTTLEMSEGQLFGRLVPYNTVAKVVDRLPNGDVDIYDEGFRTGVFGRQMLSEEPGVVRRIELVHTHERSDFLGPAINLADKDDGAYGEFKVLRSKRSDVEDLISSGISELSVEFLERPKGTSTEDGIRWRTDGHLIRVALEAMGAYREGAAILAYRDLNELAAEKAEAEAAVQAEADAAAAEQAAAEARQRTIDEIESFLAEAKVKQAELAERFTA